jgi:hypothetical protein
LICFLTMLCMTGLKADGGEPPADLLRGSDIELPSRVLSRDEAKRLAPSVASLLEAQDPAARAKAVVYLRMLIVVPEQVVDGIPVWGTPLLKAGEFDLLEELCKTAIIQRAYDTNNVVTAQRLQVEAYRGQKNVPAATIAALAYLNVVPLDQTVSAAKQVASIMREAGDAVGAEKYLNGIMSPNNWTSYNRAPTSQPELSGDSKSFKKAVDESPLEFSPDEQVRTAISELVARKSSKGQYSINNLIARGNLNLLAGRLTDAGECFQQILEGAGGPTRNTRDAISGMARVLRGSNGVSAAETFIIHMRSDPGICVTKKLTEQEHLDYQDAAFKVFLAGIQNEVTPPEESIRTGEERGISKGSIQVSTDFEGSSSVQVLERTPTHLAVRCNAEEWFAFRVRGAKNRLVRIDLISPAPDGIKWQTLNPVVAYVENPADAWSKSPTGPPNTIPTKLGSATDSAWNGAIIPLADDTKWAYIKNVWHSDAGTISFVHRFTEDNAIVAMRPLCNSTFSDTELHRLVEVVNAPARLLVESAGTSNTSQQPLTIAIVGMARGSIPPKPTVLVYAREHGDEPDGTWFCHGIINQLLDKSPDATAQLEKYTFIIIPILDVDAAIDGKHASILASFSASGMSPDAEAYKDWVRKWMSKGNRIDLVVNMHNTQSRESLHIACPAYDAKGPFGKEMSRLHFLVNAEARKSGYSADAIPGGTTAAKSRFAGWLETATGSPAIAFELNSQEPSRHLNILETEGLAVPFLKGVEVFLSGESGQSYLAFVDIARKKLNSTPSSPPSTK